ncbi:MAG TPA: class I tRNA ligase family protein, partial [Nitrososphaerales archaeon]
RETGDLIGLGHYDRALRKVLDLSAKCNQYFQHKAPWEKGADERTTVYYACNLVAGLATLLSPFLPFTSEEIWSQLGFEAPIAGQGWDSASKLRVEAGRKLREPKPLFKKVEDADLSSVSVLLG